MGYGEMHFARRIYRRMKDALDRECPKYGLPTPALMFFVEKGVGERPHLHGIIEIPSLRKQVRALREILIDVAGKDWKPSLRDRTQLEIGSFYEPAGWINYITKYEEQTKDYLGDNIFACSRSLTQKARRWYEQILADRGILLPGGASSLRSTKRTKK